MTKKEYEEWIRKEEIEHKKFIWENLLSDPLKAFPEARKQIIPNKIKEHKREIKRLETNVREIVHRFKDHPDSYFVEAFAEEWLIPQILSLEKKNKKLKMFLKDPAEVKQGQITQNMIEKARQFPIDQIAGQKLEIFNTSQGNFLINCPFHDDKHPSCQLYINSNRFICWSCQAKGDVITLTQQLFGLSFHEAVQVLQ